MGTVSLISLSDYSCYGIEMQKMDFPGGSMVKSPSANAEKTQVWSQIWKDPVCLGAAKPMNLCSTAKNHNLLETHVWTSAPQQEKNHSNEKPMHCN